MAMTKRGFMFAFVTIFLISIFVLMLSVATSNIMQAQQQAAAERTESNVMNMFTKTLTEDYFTTFVKIAGATGLRAMTQYINVSHTPLDDPEAFYADIMVNGTVPTYYTRSADSKDFAMTLIARNGTDEVTVASIAAESTELFGNETVIVQRIAAPASFGNLENIKSISLTIENSSASSGDLYLVLYNSTENLVGIDHQQYEKEKKNYTFSFGGHFPLKTNDYYDVALAAPFTESNKAYTVEVASSSEFSCSLSSGDCDLATWTVLDPTVTSGDVQNVPIDFYLGKPIMSEGFLRALANSFEGMGKDELNIDTWINITNVTVDEDSPWTIDVNASFVVSTSKTTVSFSNIQSAGEAEISIIGIEDPYSILNEDEFLDDDHRYFQIVEQNVSDDFSDDDFLRHVTNHTFVFNENATSLLERFKGADAERSSCCGIQAIYLSTDISGDVDKTDKGYSYVDHKFQEATECSTEAASPHYLYYISGYGTSEAPLLEYEDCEFYNIDSMTSYSCIKATCPNEP